MSRRAQNVGRQLTMTEDGIPVLPPEPAPTHRDGVLRQTDVPALPSPIPGSSYVYQLLDPVTREPRYVGRTRTPAIRRQGHRTRRPSKHSAVNEWHRRLSFHGLRPVMRILEGPVPYGDAARREEAWRQAHLQAGCELLNAVPCVDGLHEGREGWTWQEALSEVRALVTRLGVGSDYPTRRQFADNGLSGLDSTIERRLGGHRRVAAKLGLAMPRPEWSSRSAERAVRRLVATLELARYPTPAEFEDAGQSGLFQAIATRFGGHSEFARRLGLPRSRTSWTSERVDHAIRDVAAVASPGRYPTEREMQRYGQPGLPNAASQFGGNRSRAARLGLRMTRQVWSPNTATAAVLEVVKALSLDAYPTQAQFRAAGMSGVHRAITIHLGGHDAMASQLGLPRRQGHSGQ